MEPKVINTIEIIKFIFDIVLTTIAIGGVYFSFKALKDSKTSNEYTKKSYELSQKQYRIDSMPLLHLKFGELRIINKEEHFGLGGNEFLLPIKLINSGRSMAKNINLSVFPLMEENDSWHYLNNRTLLKKYDIDLDKTDLNYISFTNQDVKDNERKYEYNYGFKTLGNNCDFSVIPVDSEIGIDERFLSTILKYLFLKFHLPNPNELNRFTGADLLVEIEYDNVFGDKIQTIQNIDMSFSFSISWDSSENPLKITQETHLDLKEKDITFNSKLLEN